MADKVIVIKKDGGQFFGATLKYQSDFKIVIADADGFEFCFDSADVIIKPYDFMRAEITHIEQRVIDHMHDAISVFFTDTDPEEFNMSPDNSAFLKFIAQTLYRNFNITTKE